MNELTVNDFCFKCLFFNGLYVVPRDLWAIGHLTLKVTGAVQSLNAALREWNHKVECQQKFAGIEITG